MKTWLSKWRRFIPFVLISTATITAAVLITNPKPAVSESIVECAEENAAQFGCWRERYESIVEQQTPEIAFVDFKRAYEANTYVKSNCHQIGHIIGRASAKKYSSLSKTYAHGDTFCWSGYYHGAVETIANDIGAEKIVAQTNNVCADFLKNKPTSFDHYNCVHGMGHGLMAIYDNELFQALETCAEFEGDWQKQSCYGGVFMENIMVSINSGHPSKYLRNDDPLYPCTAVEDPYKNQCYLMQTSHALTIVNYNYGAVFDICSKVGTPFDTTCYRSLGRDISGQSLSNKQATIERCMLGKSDSAQLNCFMGAAKDFIAYYHSDKEALAMCTAIPSKDISASCTKTAKEFYKTF